MKNKKFVLLFVAALILLLASCGTPTDNTGKLNTPTGNTESKADDKSVGFDGTIIGDCFDISIVDAKWADTLDTSIGVVTPENEGTKLLCLIFSAKNTTEDTKNVANSGFNAYVDGEKILPTVVAGSIDNVMALAGAVSSGMEFTGFSVWELPDDWKEFQTSYIDAGTGAESKQYFILHPEDIA